MRSDHPILSELALNPTHVLLRKREEEKTPVKTEAVNGVRQPQAKEHYSHQKLEESRRDSALELSGKVRSC